MKPLSASQIKGFKLCERRWGYRQLDGRSEPSSPAMAKGTALHLIAEAYLRDGTAPPDNELGRLFTLGLPFLPPPGTAHVEGTFKHELDGVPFTGAIDLTHAREGVLVLQDHKTSSDPTRYGLREKADYLADPQALIYARYLMWLHDRTEIVLEWVYYRTKGKPKAQATAVLVTRAEVEEAYASVVKPTAEKIVEIRRKGLRAADLPRNIDACLAFGQRCPHYDVCNPLGQDNDMALPIDDDFFAEPTNTVKPTLMQTLDTSDDDQELEREYQALEAKKAAKAAKVAKQQQDAIDAAKAQALKALESAPRDLINAPEKAAKKAPKIEPVAAAAVAQLGCDFSASTLKIVCEELSAALAKIAARL